jgi:hypothetical protein
MGWMGLASGAALGGSQWVGLDDVFAAEQLEETSDQPDTGLAINQSNQTRWERSAQRKQEQTKNVTWLTHEPLDFLLRRGDHSDDEAEHYQRMLDPENLKRMAAAGVIYGRIFFYKGFGLEYEKPHME